MEREERRQQREAIRRQKELERQAKEAAKLSDLERAQLEVSTFENQLELLISVHKDHGPTWDWPTVAASLAPPQPQRLGLHELRARQQACLPSSAQDRAAPDPISLAQAQDDRDYQEAVASYQAEINRSEYLKSLARRILDNDLKAYTEALTELNPVTELSVLGSSIHFTVHDTNLVECVIKVAGPKIIPDATKSLTTTGKLSVKPMPRTRLHELYQDHICSSMLRVARETFALLPVDTILVTAQVENKDMSTRRKGEQPVLSALFPRERFLALDFDRLDPSDAVETFEHRGDFKASRKTSAFAPISPMTLEDIGRVSSQRPDIGDLLAQVRTRRNILQEQLDSLCRPSPQPEPTIPPLQ